MSGMGIIGDAFRKLFTVIWDVIVWVGNLLKRLFQGLIDLLTIFFEAIFALIDGLLYFLFQVGVIAVKIFILFFETGKLLFALIVGFGKSLASLNYAPRSTSNNGYSDVLGKVFQVAEPLQLDVVAYILLFVIWFTTAIAALKLLSSVRVGGD